MILTAEPKVRPAAAAKCATRFLLLDGTNAQSSAVADLLSKPLGFEPEVIAAQNDLALLEGLEGEAFLLPLSLEFGLFESAIGHFHRTLHAALASDV